MSVRGLVSVVIGVSFTASALPLSNQWVTNPAKSGKPNLTNMSMVILS